MTGYTVHTGSNEQFSTGWDQIFKKSGGAGAKKKAAAKKKSVARAGSRKPARKR
jgi:hypothetical protein